ncbi:MAG TPA: 2-C-methyl-D-erythritol 2,4-cyclodiphosphate synthase [Nitrospirae bacterium]|nr:2-C-methyl-D-erythritol 2,4-cyclodiphosphate synthase [Nitrospirota bacterium]
MRIGTGYDSHRLVRGRALVIGGVNIPFEMGLLGHSDGDVLVHAIIDSLIGALGTGDIGRHFPDTDPQWKDASSLDMLKYIVELVRMNDFEVAWIDSTVIAERPRLAPFIPEMIRSIEKTGVPDGVVNIKAKSNEGMGFVGRGEGIAAMAVALLKRESPA